MSALRFNLSADELALRLNQQELVAGFGLFALEPGPVRRLLDEACRLAAEGLQTPMSKVLRFREAEGDFLVEAGMGWRPGVVGHATLPGGLDSPAGFALHTGRPTLANHLAQESRFHTPALLVEHGVQSAINVVIGPANQAPFGVLEADSTRRHEFVDADQAFLQGLANVLAAGLARAGAEEQAVRLAEQKELLIREVHHRVSNSLQLVRTLLALQSRNAAPEVKAELDTVGQRIMSIAAVHRRLHESSAEQDAESADYLRLLLADMGQLLEGGPEPRPIELHAAGLRMSPERLTSLGLIVTELVTNAAKHGQGRIRVDTARRPEGLLVTVTDGGQGFEATKAPGAREGLGMRLIRTLAKGDPADAVTIDRSVPFGRVSVLVIA